MEFDTKRPLCNACYPRWAKYKNADYEEKRCHSCGKEVKATFRRPLCAACHKSAT
jgi:hypothetical protein